MRRFMVPVLGVALLLASTGAYGVETLVTLTMEERVGATRDGEWVTMGVPLPKGKIKSTDELVLLQGGKPIPAEILPVNKWWDDGSLRWVHLIFRSNCAAKGKAAVTLATGARAPTPRVTVKVTQWADRYVVDTGALVFEVRKKRFNVIDSARVGGEQVIASHNRGLGLRAPVDVEEKVEVRECLALYDRDAQVTLEEVGPLHVVIRATGSFFAQIADYGKLAPEKRFDFDCRLYAYAGSPVVKVVVTISNRQGKTADFIPLSALFLEIPTTVKKGNCLFGKEDGSVAKGSLAMQPEAYVYQSSSSKHVLGGAVKGAGGGKQKKSDTFGWGDLSDGKKGLAAGAKWFWQLHPKSVQLTADGLVRVGLYPARHPEPRKIYTGVARTHEVQLAFHSGAGNARKLMGVFAGLQKPLRPFAPPKWYCRDTQGLGDYCEAGGKELYGPYADKVKAFDEGFEGANRACQEFRDDRNKAGVNWDSYGFLEYGDGMHHVWTSGVAVRENIAWDGNYYGYPQMMATQFIRTGNVEYFDNFEAHALHVADVHTVHYNEKPEIIGGCRYCPPTDHVRLDPENSRDYKTAPVYVSNLFNHHKVAGVIYRWYFLRDHRSLDVANMVLDYVYRWTYGDNDYGQPRGPGMIMDFCYQGYMLTGDKKWIPRCRRVLDVHRNRNLNLSFQAGIWLEGLRKYYMMSGDPAAFNYIKKTADQLIAAGRGGGTTAQVHSFMFLKTGDKKYLQEALGRLPTSGQYGNPWKDYALSMRNAVMAIGDLYRAAQKPPVPPPPVGVLTLETTKDARITCHPSEERLNSGGATRLRVSGIDKISADLVIMDFNRRVIRAFVDKHAGKKVSAKLVLQVREVSGGPGKVELAILDSAVDWGEGEAVQGPALRGDCTFREAQTDISPWTTPVGEAVSNLRDLFYDAKAKKVTTALNSTAVEVAADMKSVSMPLDDIIVRHLVSDPWCRGVVLFTRHAQAKLDFWGAPEEGQGPKLVLAVGEKPKPEPPKPPVPPVPVIPKVGEKVTLKPTKDARITGHPSEARLNSGGATRLRARDLNDSALEMFIIDFDHALIKTFLEQHKGKKIEAKVVLQYREHGGGKLEVATLDSAVDWGEGKSIQGTASKGDCSYVAAQTGVKAWATADGKEVANLRDLIYDRSAGKVKTLLNSSAVQVEPGVQTVNVPLDMKLLEHLATDANCRGLVFFTRDPIRIDVYGAEQEAGQEPKLLLSVTGKPVAPPVPPAPPVPVMPKVGEKVTLKPTKDARITGHPSEARFNSGGATRLRARELRGSSVEMPIMDFDKAVIKAFLEQNKGKNIEARVVLVVRDEPGVGKLEVAVLDSAVDWVEGKLVQKSAPRGDCSYVAAQTGIKPWTTVGGQEVANLRDLIYDRAGDKVKTLLNSGSADVAPGMETVSVPLDMNFLKHLATDPNCRGLVFFTRSSVSMDFYGREQSGREPKLLLSVVEKAVPVVVPPVAPTVPKLGTKATLNSTKDARITCHRTEERLNSGGAERLRASGVHKTSADLVILDFDHAVIKAFLEQNKGKTIQGSLVLQVREVAGGPGKLEVAALDSAVDWGEGKGVQNPARRGDCTFLAAQTGVKPWTMPDGKEVANLRDLFYAAGKVKTTLNSASVEVASGMQSVSVPLDLKLLQHLASDKNSRGLVLFTRHPQAKLDFWGAPRPGQGPKLVLNAR